MTKRVLSLVDAMHITASVFINDDEYGLHQDYEKWLEGLAPHAPIRQYRHNDTGEGNADAHMKRQIMGREVVVAVTNGRSTLAPGSRSSTASSMASGASECWSRSLVRCDSFARNYANRHREWTARGKQPVASQPQDALNLDSCVFK